MPVDKKGLEVGIKEFECSYSYSYVLTLLQMLMSTRSPLAELNVLKKICDHPRLLSTLACEQLGLDEEARFGAQFCNSQ